jgi:hypothetical protein
VKLSSANLKFMTESVGLIITQGLFIPVGPADANAMLLIALYMGQDEEAHREFQHRLQDRGDLVLRIWRNYFANVMEKNLEGSNYVSESVQDLIRRAGQ